MNLHSLKAPKNSRQRKKRVGRGQGSGLGKTAGRGGKGQKARTGNMHFEGFEGGQSPLQRRLPKRGFLNPFTIRYATLNVGDLEAFFEAGAVIDEQALRARGLVKGEQHGIKILGDGELKKKLTVKAHKFSAKAKELIEKAGGAVEVIEAPKKAEKSAKA
jgi:large subunit ribosomal protein L15